MPTTRYVNALTGSDSNAGTDPAPYATIGRAVTAAAAGDLVIVRGDGAVYPEEVQVIGATKQGVVFEGVGQNSKPVIEGGSARQYGFKMDGANQAIRGFEIRNFTKSGIYLAVGSSSKGVLRNQVVEGNHIHHSQAPGVWAFDNYGVECRYSNPTVRGNTIHHIAYGGECKGILFNYCNDHKADGNDIFAVRKEAIRDSVGLRGQIINNKLWNNWSAMHIATCVGPLVANNFSYLNSVGLSNKHNNDPNVALAPWGYTLADVANGVVPRPRCYHNTIYGATSQHILFAIDNAALAATGGYSYFVEMMNNLILGPGTEYLWENPESRPDSSNVLDYNVYESRPERLPIRFAREGPSAPLFATMAALTAGGVRTQNWEVNGRQLAVDLVDPANGNLNPIVAPSPVLELATSWGSQVGARQSTLSQYRWKPETPIVVSSKSLSALSQSRMTDGRDDVTISTVTSVDESMVIDFGAPVTTNHVRWSVFGHADIYGTHHFSLETGPSSTGPWTAVAGCDHAEFPDSFAAEYLWEFPATTSRYWQWTSHDNFYVTTLTAPVTLPAATLPVASTRYTVANSLGVFLQIVSSGDVSVGAAGATRVHFTGRTETALTGCTGGTGSFVAGDRVSWRDLIFVEIAFGTLSAGELTPPPVTAPTADAGNPPQIIGTVQVGQQLSLTTGAWQGTGITYTYQWRIAGGVVGTGSTFTPIASQAGTSLTGRVIATNSAGTASADSAAQTVASAVTGVAPVCTQIPGITGTPQTGMVLIGTLGQWDNSPTSYAQKWQRNTAGSWADIASATNLTYALQAADEGKQVRLVVTATNATGSATALSVPVNATAVPVAPSATSVAGRWV